MRVKEETEIVPISPDAPFYFHCGPEVPCFNACCGDLNQYLSPYDVLRLKKNLGVSSPVFLDTCTVRHEGPRSGLPVVSLRPKNTPEMACPFVTDQGCRVYADRPASCRMYPIMRMAARDRSTGTIREEYMLMREPHCHGFSSGRPITVNAWMADQGLIPYNAANDDFLRVLGVKRRDCPGILPQPLSDRIFTALYDSDRFAETIAGCRYDNDEAYLRDAYEYVIGCLQQHEK